MHAPDAIADPAPPAPTPPADAPAEVRCPRCDYDLRGLEGTPDPRCPECGYAIDYAALRDAARHPYLFEHHPYRNGWSFARTALAGLRPSRFWSTLRPETPVVGRRLAAYAAVALALALLGPLAIVAAEVVSRDRAVRGFRAAEAAALAGPWASRARVIVRDYGSVATFLDEAYPPVTSWRFWRDVAGGRNYYYAGGRYFGSPDAPPAVALAVGLVAWPAVTAAGLAVFGQSMRRARVRPAHVARCVGYAADVGLWTVPLLLAESAVLWGDERRILRVQEDALHALGLDYFASVVPATLWLPLLLPPAAVLVTVFSYRLAVAYRRYLRFDHPVATVLATQAIALLVAAIALLNWPR